MIRGLTTAASGIIANERQQEILANNLANAETPGYKGVDGIQGTFREMLLYRMNDHSGAGPVMNVTDQIGTLGLGTQILATLPRFTPGNLKQTDKPTDLAIIDGEDPNRPNRRGFFPVLAGGRVQLTRDGSFHPDADGYLVDALGNPLLVVAQNGQVLTNARVYHVEGSRFRVVDPATGQPPIDPSTGAPMANFTARVVVDVDDVTKLAPKGNGLYDPAGAVLLPSQAQLKQGALEESNVDLTQTMVNMISVLRNYEANTRVVRTLDQTLEKAANEVGKV
jgi:flagellar basal-body rod protein FlgF